MDLQRYHGKRIVVVINRGGRQQVYRGVAAFELDPDLGPIIRIPLQEQGRSLVGNPAFVLRAEMPDECLVADTCYGCDFRLDASVGTEPTA